ncbi:MAG: hypothetical protein QOF61_1144, partial [Acidobacteriota bacterium]|nr:hypothetical protein [Acidobacteriota bacterium]
MIMLTNRRFLRAALLPFVCALLIVPLALPPAASRAQQAGTHTTPSPQQQQQQTQTPQSGMGGVSTGAARTYASRRTVGITDPKAPKVFEDVTPRTAL